MALSETLEQINQKLVEPNSCICYQQREAVDQKDRKKGVKDNSDNITVVKVTVSVP